MGIQLTVLLLSCQGLCWPRCSGRPESQLFRLPPLYPTATAAAAAVSGRAWFTKGRNHCRGVARMAKSLVSSSRTRWLLLLKGKALVSNVHGFQLGVASDAGGGGRLTGGAGCMYPGLTSKKRPRDRDRCVCAVRVPQ